MNHLSLYQLTVRHALIETKLLFEWMCFVTAMAPMYVQMEGWCLQPWILGHELLMLQTGQRLKIILEAIETNNNARLQLTTSRRGVVWFDQVSAMPLDTYKDEIVAKILEGI